MLTCTSITEKLESEGLDFTRLAIQQAFTHLFTRASSFIFATHSAKLAPRMQILWHPKMTMQSNWFGGCQVWLVWQSDGILEKHDGLLSCEGKMAAAIMSCVYRWPQLSQCLHTGAQDSSPWQALQSPMPCSTMHTYQTRHINACRSIAFKMNKQAQPATLWQPCFGLQEDGKENLCTELSFKTLYVGLLEYPFFSQSLLWVKTFCLRPADAASRQHFPSNNLGTSRKNQQPVSLAGQKRQLQRKSRGS